MARRFGRFRGRGRRRSVAWLDGISTFNAAQGQGLFARTISLSNIVTVEALLWSATIGVVIPSDLPLHGGEDAVLTRVVGSLGFMQGRRDAGAGFGAAGFQIRAVVHLSDTVVNTGGANTVSPFDFLTSAGLGADEILWFRDYVVNSTPIGAAGTGLDTAWVSAQLADPIDIKAKRKVQANSCVFLTMQTTAPAGTVGIDFQMFGGLRSLLMRPR